MEIRKAKQEDLPQIRTIYDAAKSYMDASGNPNQWVAGYPPVEYLYEDIAMSRLYVCEEGDMLCGVFMFAVMEDPTYRYIEGAWLNGEPYGVIHRIASNGKTKGVFQSVVEFCKERIAAQHVKNLRIDTHEENKTMQYLVDKCGFVWCGRIYLANGDPRIAYQLKISKGA